ncbi:hypothetical protein GCM10023205_35750 [Yinghuangia aomiensis]|uniref:Uncharacterized protein n=1 Tax=Yinghuangia aomiensis TaxID=676205 RepID=A0ABP9HCK7_9ACTN
MRVLMPGPRTPNRTARRKPRSPPRSGGNADRARFRVDDDTESGAIARLTGARRTSPKQRPPARTGGRHTSNRSRSMTFVHAATKSDTNFFFASALA